ncbi:echinoidin-like [Diadema antillarum]|uniref:echinoidin-like n=1 Tax=Diadema antillarum TaxID=105358 RepID=UPI003A8A735C
MKLTIAFLVVLASYMAVGGQAYGCCPQYWTGFHGSCYRLFLAKKNWQEAENHCVRLGGHLTSVTSEAENDFLYNFWRDTFKTPSGWGFWIGYNDIRTERAWVWSDHSTLRAPYTKWRKNQPDNYKGSQNCGRMWYTGTTSDTARDWDDCSCGYLGNYICKLTF